MTPHEVRLERLARYRRAARWYGRQAVSLYHRGDRPDVVYTIACIAAHFANLVILMRDQR